MSLISGDSRGSMGAVKELFTICLVVNTVLVVKVLKSIDGYH